MDNLTDLARKDFKRLKVFNKQSVKMSKRILNEYHQLNKSKNNNEEEVHTQKEDENIFGNWLDIRQTINRKLKDNSRNFFLDPIELKTQFLSCERPRKEVPYIQVKRPQRNHVTLKNVNRKRVFSEDSKLTMLNLTSKKIPKEPRYLESLKGFDNTPKSSLSQVNSVSDGSSAFLTYLPGQGKTALKNKLCTKSKFSGLNNFKFDQNANKRKLLASNLSKDIQQLKQSHPIFISQNHKTKLGPNLSKIKKLETFAKKNANSLNFTQNPDTEHLETPKAKKVIKAVQSPSFFKNNVLGEVRHSSLDSNSVSSKHSSF